MDLSRLCKGDEGPGRHDGALDDWRRQQAEILGDAKSALEQVIEAEIIPRLALAHRRPAAPGTHNPPQPRSIDIGEFVQLLLGNGYHAVLGYVQDLGASGVSSEAILLDLFAPAARSLGEMWKADMCDFVEVTMALSMLQQLVRERSTSAGLDPVQWSEHKRILLAPAPNEQHTLGISIVEKFFLAAGWDVWGGAAGTAFDLPTLVRRESFGVIGFSLGSDRNVDALVTLIREVRRKSRNPALGVIVGGPAFLEHPDLAILIGADATAVDAQSAVSVAQGLLEVGARPV
jgi:methanogenic corrinoid protein MtbC1